MSYDNPNRITYTFGVFDFGGAADEAFAIRGPKGKKGRLWDYGVCGVVEAMNGSTITPKIAVGTAADPDAYGDELDLNGVGADSAKTVRSSYDENADKTSFDALMVNRDLPADTTILVTCTVATGSPTGQGVPMVVIDWQD
jgi:hypothetical protein